MVLIHYDTEWPALGKVIQCVKNRSADYVVSWSWSGTLNGVWFESVKYDGPERFAKSSVYFVFDNLEDHHFQQIAQQTALENKNI